MNPNINKPAPCPKCASTDLYLRELDSFVPQTNPDATIHPYKWVCNACREEQHGFYKTATDPEYAASIKARFGTPAL